MDHESELHAARQHALCTCVLLAEPHSGGGVAGLLQARGCGGIRRAEAEGALGAARQDWAEGRVYAG